MLYDKFFRNMCGSYSEKSSELYGKIFYESLIYNK